MDDLDIRDYEYTSVAWESLYDAVDDERFLEQDASIIYNSLRNRLKIKSFGDYLKRYIYLKANIDKPFGQVELCEYQEIIHSSFADNMTPRSFTDTTTKLSALSKNWLTQQSVKRNVVFLLGFGLAMSDEDVNSFLEKALCEPRINPKNPFEVICWYCYRKGLKYPKFDQLWRAYEALPVSLSIDDANNGEYTIGARRAMLSLDDDESLMRHLSGLKANSKASSMSVTARARFDDLYDEARRLAAEIYNADEEEAKGRALMEYISRLSKNEKLYDSEKLERIKRFKSKKRLFTKDDITAADIEHIICSAIPTDRHGNLTPGKASRLNDLFLGKRFSRQHIADILAGKAEISRFDLITLNFFIFSQTLDQYPNPKSRFVSFYDSTNEILDRCFFGRMIVQNPYECFLLMCILSDDPLGTYADVWELSYIL